MKKSKKKNNSNIKCYVSSCDHNNCEEGTCQLENVTINSSCDNKECHECEDTICQSFKTTGANINDNEYEIQADSK